jgi:hypothetical protein
MHYREEIEAFLEKPKINQPPVSIVQAREKNTESGLDKKREIMGSPLPR